MTTKETWPGESDSASSLPTPPGRGGLKPSQLLGWLIRPLLELAFGRIVRRGKPYPRWLTRLPNQLTWSRAGFPLYGGLFTYTVIAGYSQWAAAAFVVIVAAYLTDAIDGELARYLECTSEKGARLDPIFDKLAGVTMLICWGILLGEFDPGLLPLFIGLATVRISEDLALAIIAEREAKHGLKPKAGPWGKIKSATDVAGVLFACLAGLRYAVGEPGVIFMAPALFFLMVAVCIAPKSIQEHWTNLRRR